MIIAKIIIFFFALGATLDMIDLVIKRYLLNTKDNYEDLHYNFTHGYMTIFEFKSTIITLLLWSTFYALHLF